jgi:bifunctional UDP-N-acetylglucosamine pyrophosphorylase/glucosamine-1-phosphate N-acetyltransferase
MQSRLRKKAMAEGVTMISPETVFLAADTKFGKEVTLLPSVVIGEDVEIGDNVQIGPFAHIRPHTKIKAGAKIGNFVEIKKSTIGKNSKVNHLSYIGDSTLGENVNIGAGTITCNYDGFDKFQTIIEDGAFIGSDSALVAPVTIGKGAIVGAGSTITKDVPANSLAVARESQKNLADWAVKFRKRKTK